MQMLLIVINIIGRIPSRIVYKCVKEIMIKTTWGIEYYLLRVFYTSSVSGNYNTS